MWCCGNCFNDEYLSSRIDCPEARIGNCDYCDSVDVSLIEPKDLMDEFDFLLSIYIESDVITGKCIIDCISADWEIFKGHDRLTSVQLLGEIIGDPALGGKYYSPASLTQITPKDKWINFCDELISTHRFFPENQPENDYLPLLFKTLKEEVVGLIFRARIQNGRSQFKKSEMGMPPAENAKGGRANPIGIPYFYAASDVKTAIAETRPHPGNNVSICKFKIVESLNVLNLISPRSDISPFRIAFNQGDDDYLLKLRYDVEFLCHLGSELSKPIVPDVADLEYLPTQYLCELIKKSEFDGVKFMSSVGQGVNYTLFSQNKVRTVSVISHYVKDLSYTTEKNT
jgi:hypothetical protein